MSCRSTPRSTCERTAFEKRAVTRDVIAHDVRCAKMHSASVANVAATVSPKPSSGVVPSAMPSYSAAMPCHVAGPTCAGVRRARDA